MHKSRSLIGAMSVVAVTALALVGCSSDGTGSTAEAGSPPPAIPSSWER